MASLAAGEHRRHRGLASLIGEKEFSILFHEGSGTTCTSPSAERLILVVVFGRRSSVGLSACASGRPRRASPRSWRWRWRPATRSREGIEEPTERRHREPVQVMSFINYSSREINCKIVYYGPGLCGKTTNLQYIYKRMNPEARGR